MAHSQNREMISSGPARRNKPEAVFLISRNQPATIARHIGVRRLAPRPENQRTDMTALAQALITRATETRTDGSLASVALFSCVGLLITLCMVRYGLDYGSF